MTPPEPKLEIVADGPALAHRLASFFAVAATEAIARHGRFDVALAGGSTPKAAYELLASPPHADHVDWDRVRFFFGDERCVPPTDDESNYKTAATRLFEPLRIRAAAVFRMRGEDEPTTAARAYASVLRRELEKGLEEIPSFDLIMLGMGPDGHTASLFPGSDPYTDDAELVRAPYVPKFATYRITLTPRAINAARRVIVATAGDEKAAALAAVIDGTILPETYPIVVVRPDPGRVTWIVDTTAASQLASRREPNT